MNPIKNLLETNYDIIWKSLIRPPRDKYSLLDLGSPKFTLSSHSYKRTDFKLYNSQKMRIECSFWEPFDEEREYERLPVIIYLPGNSSSRVEVVPLLSYILPMNITVFSFDFCGSGKSDGEYISLGYNEKNDVQTILNYLRKSNKVSTIGLWGRSMGAVTALLSAKENNNNNIIDCIVLDSCFSSLNKLINEYVNKIVPLLPNFLINFIKKYVSDIIEKKVNMRIEKIEPIKDAEFCTNIPALFCHGIDDDFIKKEHSKDLFEKYSGPKEIIMFDGNHNSKRPIHVLQIIALFFFDKLKVDSIHTLNEIYDNNLISDDDDVVNEEDNKYSSVNSIKVKNDINHYFDNL
jgi:fermentation-respiration switch protein FrsA (DUF1100 family)